MFLAGIFGLAVVLIVAGFLSSALAGKSAARTTNSETPTDQDGNPLPYDPLVTVVPEGLRGGQPQPLATDPARGAVDPLVTVIEFGDFQCEACAAMQPVMDQIVAAYPDEVQHVWKDFPIPNDHPQAETAAVAARCAQDQNAFWEYHDRLLQNQATLVLNPWVRFAEELGLNSEQFTSCLQSETKRRLVVEGYFIARALDIAAAPAYSINGEIVTGAKTVDELREIIDRKRDEAATGQ